MSRFQFPEWTRSFHRWMVLLALAAPVYLILLWAYGLDAKTIRIGYAPQQPVPYSHAVHAGKLGLDCRYCHDTALRSSHAAVPPAATCMNCHSTINAASPRLLAIREAFAADKPVAWVRVHDLPDYVYFNHSAHVRRGVGCETCHGRVDRMTTVKQLAPLTMSWCIGCHRDPTEHIRDISRVTEMGYQPAGGRRAAGAANARRYNIKAKTSCSTCHR